MLDSTLKITLFQPTAIDWVGKFKVWMLKSGRQIRLIIFLLKAPTNFYLVPLFIEKVLFKHLVSRNIVFKTCIGEKQNSKICHTFTIRTIFVFWTKLSNEKSRCATAAGRVWKPCEMNKFCHKVQKTPRTTTHTSALFQNPCCRLLHGFTFHAIPCNLHLSLPLHFSTHSFSH